MNQSREPQAQVQETVSLQTARMFARFICVVVALSYFSGLADGAAPRETAAFGVALEAPPERVKTLLEARYKECKIDRLVYRAGNDGNHHTAALALNLGLAEHDPASMVPCVSSPAGNDITDAIEARFAHPDVDGDQRLYSLMAYREYPDVVYSQPPRVRTTFAEVRRMLFQTYGKPIDERRERVASDAANRIRSLGLAGKVKREDQLIRYLWSAEGRLPESEGDYARCDCKGRNVIAVIEISKSPSTIPANEPYVLSLRLQVEHSDLRARQDAWNAQWQRQPQPQANPQPR